MASRNIIVEPNSAAVMFIRQNIDLINLGVIKQKILFFMISFVLHQRKLFLHHARTLTYTDPVTPVYR